MSSHSPPTEDGKKENNNYIDIQVIQEIYQSEGQHGVPIADRCFSSRRLLLRLHKQTNKQINILYKNYKAFLYKNQKKNKKILYEFWIKFTKSFAEFEFRILQYRIDRL